MKEPTGDIEAELDALHKRIQRQEKDIEEYKLDLEIANRTITYMEGLIAEYRYQAFMNQRDEDDWQ